MTERGAFHLPGLDASAVREWRYLEAGGVRLRWPLLDPAQLQRICETLKDNRQRFLLQCTVNEIVHALDQTSRRLLQNIDDTARLLSGFTGYSLPVVRETLERMFRDWNGDSLAAMLQTELGDASVLDRPVADLHIANKRVAAYGYPFAFHIFSGNVPGVAVTSLIRSLLVKSATLGKTAAGEPVLSVLFAEQLAHVAPSIAACMAVTYWPGGTAELEDVAIKSADLIVVYGGEDTVRAVSSRTSNQRLVVHGPRVSFGIVGPDPAADLPSEVARAVAAYDQQGCVSPHLVYVLGPAKKACSFARAVAEELKRLTLTSPRGAITAEEAMAFRNARAAAEFADPEKAELFGDEKDGYAVIFERDVDFKLSCLNRVLYVKPIPAATAIQDLLPPRHLLQSAAVEGFPDAEKAEVVRMLGLSGVSRVTSFERLPWPPMHWHHDGSAPLRELITWQDVEN